MWSEGNGASWQLSYSLNAVLDHTGTFPLQAINLRSWTSNLRHWKFFWWSRKVKNWFSLTLYRLTGMHPLKHRFNFIIQIPMVYAYWSIQLSQNTTFLLVQQTYAHILLWRIFFYDYKCKISLELWAVNVTYLCTNSMLRKDTRRDAVCISVLPSPSFSINIALQPSIICEITYFCDCLWVSFQVLLLG
jgi:hypothetical protein